MKIGDEVHVHGYVDEIRKDVVIIRNKGGYFGTVPEEVLLTDIKCLTDQEFLNKAYKMPNGREAIFYYDRNGVGKITLESVDMLMGELIAYQQCIQSRSFWDSKHCDGCRFYDNCPFNPQEDEDEPNSSEIPNNCETCRFELYCPEMCEGCCEWDSHYEPKDEPQTEGDK